MTEQLSPQTYLVGYDGSDASRSAAVFTAALAEATGARAVALAAHPHLPPALAPGASAVADAELEAPLREEAERRLAGLDVEGLSERRAVAGPPARALAEAADRDGAALLAVGTTHRGALGRTAPGSVAERLLHGAPCPVLVVPAGDPPAAVRTVAVAFDHGEEARNALVQARALATALGAELRLLSVAEPVYVGAGWAVPGVYEVLTPEVLDRLRDELQAVAAEAGAEARLLRGGTAGETLVEACREGVDLVVCGSRGYGPLRAVLAGSVSRHLADHAPCPVLVVPRSAPVPLFGAAGAAPAEAGS